MTIKLFLWQIVWDENKQRWVNLDEPEEEVCCFFFLFLFFYNCTTVSSHFLACCIKLSELFLLFFVFRASHHPLLPPHFQKLQWVTWGSGLAWAHPLQGHLLICSPGKQVSHLYICVLHIFFAWLCKKMSFNVFLLTTLSIYPCTILLWGHLSVLRCWIKCDLLRMTSLIWVVLHMKSWSLCFALRH